MKDFQLISKIEALPDLQKKEVSDFVDFLYYKFEEEKRKHLAFLGHKAFIKVSSDFYEPLEDYS